MIFIISLISRQFIQPFFIVEKNEFADGLYYNSYAIGEILSDNDWIEKHPEELDDLRAPIYPLFLALVYFFFGIENFKAVYFFQTLLSFLISYLIFILSCQFFSNKKMAYVSLIWSLVYVPYIRYSAMIGREILIFSLLIIAFYFGYKFLINRKVKHSFFFLISLIFLVHTDPRYLLFIPIIFLPLFDISGFRKGLLQYSKFILLFSLLMAPWAIRNYFYFDGIVIISPKYLDFRSNTQFEDQQQFKDEYTTKSFMKSSFGFGNPNFTIKSSKDIIYDNERKMILKGENPQNRSQKEVQAIIDGKLPANDFLSKRVWMFKQFWRVTNFSGDFFPYPSGVFNIWSLKHNFSNILLYGSLLPFFIFSLVSNFSKRRLIFNYSLSILIMQTLIHTFVWSRERYRHPIDAIIIIFGVHGMFLAYNYLKNLNGEKYLK